LSQLLPNDPAANTNQRAPGLSLPGNSGVNNGPYPYVDFYQSRSGNWWRFDETPGNIHYSHGHVSGTYEEKTPLSGTTALTVNTHHHYIGAGSTQTTEANHDFKLGASQVHHIGMDHYAEHGGDNMHAMGGDTIHASGGMHFQHATGGTQQTSSGDHTSDHNDGNHHINIAGDHVQYTGGVKYESVGTDKGTYVPNGNFDTQVSNNYNVQSGNNLSIKSNTQVTITVNGSKITILPTSIIIHDGNGNEVGMNSQQMWVGPQSTSTIVYLGGNGSSGTYDFVTTSSGPSINVKARTG
jgi:hypothetical protein